MRGRTWVLAILMTFGFVWFTSQGNWSFRNLALPLFQRQPGSADITEGATPAVGSPTASWTNPAAVRGAALSPDEQNSIEIYKLAKLATVYITSTAVRRDFFYQPVASRSLGSGFLISEDGFILTNFHVISGSSRIQVTLSDQSQYSARAVDTDRSDDLALIKITPKKKQTFLRLGDSDQLQVGQKVLAIGNPFGLEGTLTTGVVSSIGRAIESEDNERLEGMIQTDAAINGGNSGGPFSTPPATSSELAQRLWAGQT